MPVKSKRRKYELRRDWYAKYPEAAMVDGARRRAKQRGLAFTITRADVRIPSHCPALGIKLGKGGKRQACDNSPSLDRIDNTKGYIPGNVVVVSNLANQIKSTATYAQVRAVADFYEFLKLFPGG